MTSNQNVAGSSPARGTIRNYSDKDLLQELCRRGKFSNSSANNEILSELSSNLESGDFRVILTRGIPTGCNQCSRCRRTFPAKEFSYYQARVQKNGYLQRSNAVCKKCLRCSKNELDAAVKNIKIPARPIKGSVCTHCERMWSGNWHRHHQEDRFIGWLCGHCNMSFNDHRNKHIKKEH